MNRSNHTADRPIALLGSGGHAKLVFSCLGVDLQKLVQFVVSNTDVQHPYFQSIIRYASDADFLNSSMRDCSLINGIGANPNVSPRTNVFKNYKNHGFKFETVISPSAFVGEDVSIGEGALVLPNSTINVGVNIEENVVIYSGAIVEHDCQIGGHCHISPGAIILGNAVIEEETFIGAGAIIFPGVTVGSNSIIGAGRQVRKNLASRSMVK